MLLMCQEMRKAESRAAERFTFSWGQLSILPSLGYQHAGADRTSLESFFGQARLEGNGTGLTTAASWGNA